jgi:hypothetical protein
MAPLAALAALLAAQEPARFVSLHVESPKEVTLVEVLDRQRALVEDTPFDVLLISTTGRAVCKTPCVTTVPRDSDYIIAGEGIVSSAPFSLASLQDGATVRVSPGSPLMRSLSRAAAVGALLLVGSGIIFVAWGTQGGVKPPQLAIGASCLTLGLGAGIAGLVLSLVPARTRVHFE